MDVDDYIEKPINPPVLLDRVEKLLKRPKTTSQT
jgi:DNA-binding response OmpR family regulator